MQEVTSNFYGLAVWKSNATMTLDRNVKEAWDLLGERRVCRRGAVTSELGTLVFGVGILTAAIAAPAHAAPLAVLGNSTDGAATTAWWSGQAPSPLDSLLRGNANPGGWVDPASTAPSAPISRVLTRPDLTVNNARSLGALYGADRVLTGKVQWVTDGSVSWVGLSRVTVRVDAAWVGTSGAVDSSSVRFELSAYGSSREQAMERAAQLAAREIGVRVGGAPTAAEIAPSASRHEVLVKSPEGGAGFVAFMRLLREVDRGVVDIKEAWATEGAVGVAVELDEEAPFQRVVAGLRAVLARSPALLAFRITDASAESVSVEIDAPSPAAEQPR